MAGKKKSGEDEATSQPKQQVQDDDASQTGATNFGNIDQEGEQFGNINPD